jgi:uncharacterized protein (TIGR02996 family)
MSTREGFLADIVERPEDAPRLVFADWLEENGEADRAEFIRLQVALARQAVPDTDGRLRAADLLDEFEPTWRAELPLPDGVRGGAFERGFVAWAEVESAEEFRAHADFLHKRTTARKWVIEHAEYDVQELPADWPAWDEVAGVAGLAFSFFRFAPDETATFLASPHLGGLRSLAITYSDLDSDALALLAGSAQLGGLTDLDLTNHGISAGGIRALARSPHLHGLRTLDLRQDTLEEPDRNRFDTDAVVALAGAANLAGLRSLAVCPYALTAEGCAALAGSPYLSGLRSLTLASAELLPGALRPLLGSPLLLGLERLDLRELGLTAEDVAALFASPRPPGLRSLALGVEGCGAAGVRSLLASPWAAGLTELKLAAAAGTTRLDDLLTVPALLAAADSLGGLRELDLAQLHVGDGGLKALMDAPELGRLASLVFSYSGVTRQGLRAFTGAAGLPALRRLRFSAAHLGAPVFDALADGPLTSRLVSLELGGNSDLYPPDLGPLLDRDRWPRLIRLDLSHNLPNEEAREALVECWGPAVALNPDWP